MILNAFIPTVCREDLLQEALPPLLQHRSLFGRIVVLDNGQQELGWIPQSVDIVRLTENAGFARSCNWALSCLLGKGNGDWLLVQYDSVILAMAELLPKLVEQHSDKWLLRSRAGFAAFLVSRLGAQAMEYEPGKFFDEAFWPSQYEGLDFEWRMQLAQGRGPKRVLTRCHELEPLVYHRKASQGAVPNYRAYRRQNCSYFLAKWGAVHSAKRYTTPFDGAKPWP